MAETLVDVPTCARVESLLAFPCRFIPSSVVRTHPFAGAFHITN